MYALFGGLMYYPEGGWGDFQRSSNNLEDLRNVARMVQGESVDWWHIVDLDTGRVVDRWATEIYEKHGPLGAPRSAL